MKGFLDAIEAEFPKAMVQFCLEHMMRHRWNSVGWKQREEVATGIRLIYTALTESEAQLQLMTFEAKCDMTYVPIAQSCGVTGRACSRS